MKTTEILQTKWGPVINRGPGVEETTMIAMQPLNEIRNIRGEEFSADESPVMDYDAICEICQIKQITGTCKRCGLHQYHDHFEIMVRRKD